MQAVPGDRLAGQGASRLQDQAGLGTRTRSHSRIDVEFGLLRLSGPVRRLLTPFRGLVARRRLHLGLRQYGRKLVATAVGWSG
ncbi:hypothetical protein NOVOSPHI9U_20090 [Novosphingobium sp. 9U]|nr:hypothetical protein NOVOSPHI9U_20090 [Novosphingobium sp. 9U]